MKTTMILLLVAMIMAISLPASAEKHNNVIDQLGDVMSGHGNTYAGLEVIKDDLIKPLGIPLGIKVWTDCLIGEIDDDVRRDIRGGVRLRLKI